MEDNNALVTISGNLPGDGSIPPSITAEELRALLIEVLGPPEEEKTTGESVSGNDMTVDMESVSGNDAGVSDNSVSGNDILTDIYTGVQQLQDVPIWEKPLTDYTAAEGLLLLMFILLLGLLAGQIMRGGERHV